MKNRKKNEYIFPDMVNCQYQVIEPFQVLCADFTSLQPIKVNGLLVSYTIFIIIDLGSCLLAAKAFKIGDYKAKAANSNIPASFVIKFLKSWFDELLRNQQFNPKTQQIILHTDRGPQFVSKVYHQFIKNTPYLIGSMTPPHKPTANAVVEGWNFALKERLSDFGAVLSEIQEVKQIRDLNLIIFKKIDQINRNYRSTRSMHLGAYTFIDVFNNFQQIVKKLDHKETKPIVKAALSQNILPKEHNPNLAIVQKYREIIVQVGQIKKPLNSQQIEQLGVVLKNQISQKLTNDARHSEILEEIAAIKTQLKFITTALTQLVKIDQNKTKPKKTFVERPPLTQELFTKIMHLEKKKEPTKKTQARHRFLIYLILLWFRGLRINELRGITKEDLQSLMKGEQCKYQRLKKKKTYESYFLLTPKGIQYLKENQYSIDAVFKKNKTIDGEMDVRSVIRSFNRELRVCLKYLNVPDAMIERYSSHSCRINFINVLKDKGVDERIIQKKVGHANLETTQGYYRSDESTAELINKAIDSLF